MADRTLEYSGAIIGNARGSPNLSRYCSGVIRCSVRRWRLSVLKCFAHAKADEMIPKHRFLHVHSRSGFGRLSRSLADRRKRPWTAWINDGSCSVGVALLRTKSETIWAVRVRMVCRWLVVFPVSRMTYRLKANSATFSGSNTIRRSRRVVDRPLHPRTLFGQPNFYSVNVSPSRSRWIVENREFHYPKRHRGPGPWRLV